MAIGTTAAILGAAAIGTAGSVIAGSKQASAAESAAQAQAASAEQAAELQLEATQQTIQAQQDALQQGRIDAYPWAIAGAQALYKYMDELGVPRPETPILPNLDVGPLGVNNSQEMRRLQDELAEAQEDGDADRVASIQGNIDRLTASSALPAEYTDIQYTEGTDFQETPGYEYTVQEAEKGVLNNLAALGMKNSGAALKELTRVRTGLANQEYGNYLNRLSGMAGMGQSQVLSNNNALMSGAGNIGNALMTGAANQGNAIQSAGAARASGYVGSANAWGNAIGGITNSLGQGLGALAYSQPQSNFPTAPTYGVGLY